MALSFLSRNVLRIACLAAILWGLVLNGTTGLAQSSLDISNIRIGVADLCKVGRWTPVVWQVHGGATAQSGRWELRTVDGEGEDVAYVDRELTTIAAGQTATTLRYVRVGRLASPLRICWQPQADRSEVLEWDAGSIVSATTSTQQTVAFLGKDIDWSLAWRTVSRQTLEPPKMAQLAQASDAPISSLGWDAFDIVVITSGNRSFVEQLSIDQLQGLVAWVRYGGRVIFAAGQHAQFLIGENGPLAPLSPGTFVSIQPQFETTRLESFAGAQERLDLLLQNDPASRQGLVVARLRDIVGRVEVSETVAGDRIPMIVHGSHGLGQVIFVAFDLDQAPVTTWTGYSRMIAKLLQSAGIEVVAERDETTGGQLSHLGFRDLSGQLRASLEQYPSTKLMPFGVIAVLAGLYVLWIGPGDYLLSRRMAASSTQSWLAFGAAVGLSAGFFLYLGQRGTGSDTEVNQVDLVDWDLRTGAMRGTSWLHVHVPDTQQYQAKWTRLSPWSTSQSPEIAMLEWHGLPGNSFGGIDAPPTNHHQLPAYQLLQSPQGQTLRAADIVLPAGTSRAFRGRWWEATTPVLPSLRATAAGYLEGTLQLPVPTKLYGTKLLFGRWYYDVGDLSADTPLAIDERLKARSLKNWLARREVVDGKDVATPWDQASLDTERVLEMLMFHEQAGGHAYTGLMHRFQPWLDLSAQLTAGHAILVGRLDESPAEWELSSAESTIKQNQQWSVARIVIPVDTKGMRSID